MDIYIGTDDANLISIQLGLLHCQLLTRSLVFLLYYRESLQTGLCNFTVFFYIGFLRNSGQIRKKTGRERNEVVLVGTFLFPRTCARECECILNVERVVD